YLDYKTFLADDVLALSDRMAMAHSLEIRVPFVDHLLVERVFPLSDRVKIGWWRNKRLLKRALRGRLPDEHLRAPKRGFVGPTAEWLRHELRDVIEDQLAPERLPRLGQFRATARRSRPARRARRRPAPWDSPAARGGAAGPPPLPRRTRRHRSPPDRRRCSWPRADRARFLRSTTTA